MCVPISLQPDIGTFKDRAWGGGWGPGGPPPHWTGERPGPIRGHGLKTGPGASAAGGGRRCHGGRRGGGHEPPFAATRGGPCCQGPAGRDGGLGPHT